MNFVSMAGALALACCLFAPTTPASAQIPDKATDICALMPGQSVGSELQALDVDGNVFDLSAALADKPSLVIFFRGAW